jgi:hypothetical protein
MESSPTNSNLLKQITNSAERLETQHIAFNIELDKISRWIAVLKVVRIILLSLTVTSFLTTFFGPSEIIRSITALAAVMSFLFLLADYNFRFEENKTILKTQAQNLWYVLEKYKNTITDMQEGIINDEKGREIRDNLSKELPEIYSRSPLIKSTSVASAKKRLSFKKYKSLVNSAE